MTRTTLTSLLVVGLLACGSDDPLVSTDPCMIEDLPHAGEQGAPLVTDVTLEVQDQQRIVALVTASDPQGSSDLLDVIQVLRVFQDESCATPPVVLEDDLAGSGVEESFGTVAETISNLPLFASISTSSRWPVELEFQDVGGNVTQGRVEATVRQ